MNKNKQIYYIEAKVEFNIKAPNEKYAIALLKNKLNWDDNVFLYYGDSIKIIKVEEDPYDE